MKIGHIVGVMIEEQASITADFSIFPAKPLDLHRPMVRLFAECR